jgi:signal transduction histidine kinase/ActR/RegA family two-component response regulator
VDCAFPENQHPAVAKGGKLTLTGSARSAAWRYAAATRAGARWRARVLVLALLIGSHALNAAAPSPAAPAPESARALEHRVKAAFLFRFTEFVAWPETAFLRPDSPFTIAVVGREGPLDELRQITAGRNIAGRPVEVRRVSEGEPMAATQVIFIPEAEKQRLREWVRAAPRHALLVTESDGALARGSVINFVDAFNNMLAEIGRRSDALLTADRMKDQFLATLAHELRNPLAPISNALHLLETAGDRPEMAADARRMMARQLKQLVRLVDDLLDVSRITTGKLVLHVEPTDLENVIQNAVEIARPLIESRRHRLVLELPSHPVNLQGDETRLAQVFSNLLNNAARYTEPGGTIELRAQLGAAGVEVSVTDDGIGIAPEMLPGIFEMFTQANTSIERAQAGLGVGLALARRLVEMHGGTIQASSAGLGRGSRFMVRLPLTQSARAPAPAAQMASERSGAACRVLVVDDNQDFATSLAMILRDLGNDVRVEHEGIDSLRAAEAFQPAVAFLDIGLPGMNGYDLARKLREHQRNSTLVLVAVTGWGQDTDKLRAGQAGFDYHLVKPIDPGGLPAILQAAADKRERASRRGPYAPVAR